MSYTPLRLYAALFDSFAAHFYVPSVFAELHIRFKNRGITMRVE